MLFSADRSVPLFLCYYTYASRLPRLRHTDLSTRKNFIHYLTLQPTLDFGIKSTNRTQL